MKTLLILKPKQSVIWCHLPLQLAPSGMPLAACLLAITVGGGTGNTPGSHLLSPGLPVTSQNRDPKKVVAAAS